jgi:peptidoglycan/LPS O-acetylase OafA/YrhL
MVYPPGSTSMLASPYVIVIVAFLLSIMTYYFVENQIRFRKSKAIPIILLAVMVLMGITSILICNNASYFKESYI